MNQNALWISFDQYRFVLGMEWRLLDSSEKLVRGTLSKLRREGLEWYASSGLQDFVGICSSIPESKKPMYSAALHLADQWSSGGVELFVFGMPQQRVAVVALNAGRPVPGFDFIGNMDEAQSLIEEFEAMYQGTSVRRVGDMGLLADEEQLSAQTVFDQPRAETKLKQIPSLKALLITVGFLVLGLAALAGLYYLQIHEREDLLKNLPKPSAPKPPDPNPAYLASANQLVQSLATVGHQQHTAWPLHERQLRPHPSPAPHLQYGCVCSQPAQAHSGHQRLQPDPHQRLHLQRGEQWHAAFGVRVDRQRLSQHHL